MKNNMKWKYEFRTTIRERLIKTTSINKALILSDDIEKFIEKAISSAVEEEREEVRKIVADYQNFKTNELGLEMALCAYLKKNTKERRKHE